jgi:hypothetical protein
VGGAGRNRYHPLQSDHLNRRPSIHQCAITNLSAIAGTPSEYAAVWSRDDCMRVASRDTAGADYIRR